MTEVEVGGMHTEDRKGLRAKGSRWPLEVGKGKETDPPWGLQKERSPVSTPTSACKTRWGLLASRTVREYIYVVLNC